MPHNRNLFIGMYEYLFYKTYMFMKWPKSKNIGLEYAAAFWTAGFLCASFFTILDVYDWISDKQTLALFFGSLKWSSCILAPAFFINYFLFIYKHKYKRVIRQYEKESEAKRKVGNLFAWVCIFLSMFGVIIVELLKVIFSDISKILKSVNYYEQEVKVLAVSLLSLIYSFFI